MKHFSIMIPLVVALLCVGCAQNIPMKSSINEYVLMNIKTSSQKGIDYTFSSDLVGKKLALYGRNKQEISGNYICDESGVLNSMLKEYVENKFFEITDTAPISLSVKLVDFYVEYYSTDSIGSQILQSLLEEDSNYMSSSKLSLILSLTKEGIEINKRITTSADATTSGAQNIVGIGDSINQANNKALMLINAFLAENGL